MASATPSIPDERAFDSLRVDRVSYRTALIGLSWIATDPAGPAPDPVLGTAIPFSHASAMAAIPEIDVVAGCDIVAAARDRFVTQWGGRWPGLRVYDDYQEMLERERPDLVAVVIPDHLHTAPVLAAIEFGARGIFCEKPLATSLGDADQIVAAAASSGVAICVDYTRRWMPEFVEARRQIRSGAIGRLSQIVIQLGGPRAMLFRNHTHMIDLLNYYAEADPQWVIAELEPDLADYGTSYRGDGGTDPSTDPGANYYVAFANGVRAYVSGMKDTVPEVRVDLIGARGRLSIDAEGFRLITFESEDLRSKPPVVRSQRLAPSSTVSGIQAAVLDLIAAIETGREPASSPQTARRTVAITQAILESQARGNVPVQVSPPPASVA
jgi:predicted dehydrogenase